MTDTSALETLAASAAVGIGGNALLALCPFDGDVETEESGSVEIFDGVGGIAFILEFNESVAYKFEI